MSRSKGIICAALACTMAIGCMAKEIELSEMDLSLIQQGWGTPGINMNLNGKKLKIANIGFEKGVSTHAPGKMVIKLDGEAKSFTASVGVDSGVGKKGTIEFTVKGN